ncbi:IS110 family transposase [Amycolatopsis echigonensis]|uniref:IS110 family transposase n=1 Tax=Amycolatopsis echigonensis TaxID=2576905 RepID=A0A8E1W962_9PSEU|nr:IS110 family transposase [Amycolatopsis echigonensis]MBB2506515.1 IS110 family transposase [Amycolatopsis echigonensis]
MVVPRIWAGVDIGKEHHHCVVIDDSGERLLSRRVQNDETELLALIADVAAIDTDALWAIDLNSGGAALLIGLLVNHAQELVYITGLKVHRAAGTYRGEGKTDAKDAFVIADQARVRRDLGPLRAGEEIAVDLRTLTNRRTDLVCDRTRAINRIRHQLLEYFPALERRLDLSRKGHLLLLTGYQTPDAIRRLGEHRLAHWLRHRKARNADTVAHLAIEAAAAQQTTLPGQKLAAAMVERLAKGVIALNTEIAETDAMIEQRFRQHRHAEVMLTLPGFGPVLAAEFLAATGGEMTAFGSADRLAGYAGLAPVPRDSGRIHGNLRRPRRYHRGLLRSCYLAAMASLPACPISKAYYQRKRAEGKRHEQALLCLARRRLNVIWAMLRDDTGYHASPPIPAAA